MKVKSSLCKKQNVNSCVAFILKCIFVLLPCVYVFLICWRFNMDVMNLPATVNDEIGWYTQVFSVVEYGRPLGYHGYNGTHAAIGTYGAWGAGSIWFLALFVRLLRYILPFPNFSIYIFNNLLWACMANLILILCAKPDVKKLLRFIAVYILLFVNHEYIFLGMAETMRYSMSIILAGLTIFLWNRHDHRCYRVVLYGVAPLVILSFMTSYIMYAVVLPLWILAVYRNMPVAHNHKTVFLSLGICFFLSVTAGIYYVGGQYSSPYVTDVISDILTAFQQGVVHGVTQLFRHVRNNLNRCSLQYLWDARSDSFGWYMAYLVTYYVACIYLLACFLTGRKRMCAKDWEFHGIGAYMVVAFLTAFVLLYDTVTPTLVRGINVGLVYTLFLICMSDKGTTIKRYTIVMLLTLVPFLMFLRGDVIRNHKVPELEKDYQQIFAEHIDIDEEKNPWENTVALYGVDGREIMLLPVGVGINNMISWQPNEQARYVLYMIDTTDMELDEIREKEYIPEITWQTHELLYRDNEMVLMRNKVPVLPE